MDGYLQSITMPQSVADKLQISNKGIMILMPSHHPHPALLLLLNFQYMIRLVSYKTKL